MWLIDQEKEKSTTVDLRASIEAPRQHICPDCWEEAIPERCVNFRMGEYWTEEDGQDVTGPEDEAAHMTPEEAHSWLWSRARTEVSKGPRQIVHRSTR